MALLDGGAGARRVGNTVVIEATPARSVQTSGPNIELASGSYTAVWRGRFGQCIDGATPRLELGVVTGGKDIAARQIEDESAPFELSFDVIGGPQVIGHQTWAGRCTFDLEQLTIRLLNAPSSPRAP